MKIIILAGGCGSRLWPISCKSNPKQLLDFGNGESMLKKTIIRFQKSGLIEHVYISTSSDFAPTLREHVRSFAPQIVDRVIVEPCSKNTCPAVTWAIRHLLVTNKAKLTEKILVVPADHFVSDDDFFVEQLCQAESQMSDDSIVAFAVPARKADESFGYLRITEKDGIFYKVQSFIEKPDQKLAEKISENEDWLWNTGVYLFAIKTFVEELKCYEPSIYRVLDAESHHEEYIFRSLSSISIDKAIMEKTSRLFLLKLDGIAWQDIGSWESLYDFLKKDENGNVKIGNVEIVETNNCLIFGRGKKIHTIGIEDLVIVESDDGIFISKKGCSESLEKLIHIGVDEIV